MTTRLRQYFPLIREREELLAEIKIRRELWKMFQSWSMEQQEEFLDFCTGVRGIKFLYDSFFKEIFNPESTPERLEEFLSLLLGVQVKILAVLPTDSTRIADESSLLIMDIVVQLEEGSIVNLEVQKIGYKFPGNRSACYSADLLLRQYKRVRSEKRKSFTYKDVKGVYTIVLFEKSPREFHQFPGIYLHYFEQQSDTGLEIDLLQKYLFIPLDIFKKRQHNKDRKSADNELEGWLSFLCEDEPEAVIRLIEQHPKFRPMYEEAYEMCRNIEGVMQMFSKELAELDRNTVQLMIDEMQEELNQQKEKLDQQEEAFNQQNEAQKRLLQNIIQNSYSKLKDVNAVADMLGITVAEVEEML